MISPNKVISMHTSAKYHDSCHVILVHMAMFRAFIMHP